MDNVPLAEENGGVIPAVEEAPVAVPAVAAAEGVKAILANEVVGENENGDPEVHFEMHLVLGHQVRGPNKGEVKLKVNAALMTDADLRILRREDGPIPEAPFTPGFDFIGILKEIGEGVNATVTNRYMGYIGLGDLPVGSFAEEVVVRYNDLVSIPKPLNLPVSTAILRRGLVAGFLTQYTYGVGLNLNVLVHSSDTSPYAPFICKWVRLLMRTTANMGKLVATVSNRAAVDMADGWGCDAVINRAEEDDFVAAAVGHSVGQRGFDVVYDCVGTDDFEDCLHCLTVMGTLVCYEQSSGSPAPFETRGIISDRCLRVTFPKIPFIMGKRLELKEIAKKLVPKAGVEGGMQWPVVPYELEQASLAQEMKALPDDGQEDHVLVISPIA